MRRRLEPIEPSLTILIGPMSPVADTCVPPHNSSELPASSTRTTSPYLSPKKAMAPLSLAACLVISVADTRVLASTSALASCSMRRISAGVTAS